MKNSILTFIIALIIAGQSVVAQKNIDPTPEDIVLAKALRDKYPKDDIALLSSKEVITFGLNSETGNVTVNQSVVQHMMNIAQRSDIQKHESYDGDSEITEFIVKYRNDKKANFTVKDEFYSSDDIFYNDLRVKYMQIDFPVQGYTYTYHKNKKYNDVKYFSSLYFNDEYPIVKKEIIITVPDWLDVEIKEFNMGGYTVKKENKPDPKNKATVYTFMIEDIASYIKEDNGPGPSYLYPHLLIVAKSFTRNGSKTTLFSNTGDLYKWYKGLVNEVDEKPSELKDKVQELTAGAITDDEKIKKIYYWVQDNIRYIAFEDGLAGFRPDASQNVFKKRYGDCKGMANLIKQMLKEAGYDARLTWIGTKHIAYDSSLPSLGVNNHMICTLFKDGRKYYLDGTEKYNSLGEYAERIQGKQVLIEDGEKFIIETVPVAPASHNKEVYTAVLKIDQDLLTGTINGVLNGESRASFLYGYNGIKNDKKGDALQNYLSGGNTNYQVSNITTSDLNNRDNTLTLAYNATFKNKVSYFDNDIYVNLDYRKEYSGLDLKERKTDYEFGYKQDYESVITLEIPAGYTVTRLPKPVTTTADSYTIKTTYEQKANTIVYKKQFVFKNGSIKASEFKPWNDSFNALKKNYNEQITLTKI